MIIKSKEYIWSFSWLIYVLLEKERESNILRSSTTLPFSFQKYPLLIIIPHEKLYLFIYFHITRLRHKNVWSKYNTRRWIREKNSTNLKIIAGLGRKQKVAYNTFIYNVWGWFFPLFFSPFEENDLSWVTILTISETKCGQKQFEECQPKDLFFLVWERTSMERKNSKKRGGGRVKKSKREKKCLFNGLEVTGKAEVAVL